MCLAVPAKIVELAGSSAIADLHGNRVAISTVLTPDVHLDDWVLLHAGFAIQRLDPEAAAETFDILADLQRLAEPLANAPAGAAPGALAANDSVSQGAGHA